MNLFAQHLQVKLFPPPTSTNAQQNSLRVVPLDVLVASCDITFNQRAGPLPHHDVPAGGDAGQPRCGRHLHIRVVPSSVYRPAAEQRGCEKQE